MKNYSEQIVKAYTKWMNAIDAVPYEEWQDGYKTKVAAEKRRGNQFVALCRLNDLNYLEVAKDLMPTKIVSIA